MVYPLHAPIADPVLIVVLQSIPKIHIARSLSSICPRKVPCFVYRSELYYFGRTWISMKMLCAAPASQPPFSASRLQVPTAVLPPGVGVSRLLISYPRPLQMGFIVDGLHPTFYTSGTSQPVRRRNFRRLDGRQQSESVGGHGQRCRATDRWKGYWSTSPCDMVSIE